jgi:hypothetical protein
MFIQNVKGVVKIGLKKYRVLNPIELHFKYN